MKKSCKIVQKDPREDMNMQRYAMSLVESPDSANRSILDKLTYKYTEIPIRALKIFMQFLKLKTFSSLERLKIQSVVWRGGDTPEKAIIMKPLWDWWVRSLRGEWSRTDPGAHGTAVVTTAAYRLSEDDACSALLCYYGEVVKQMSHNGKLIEYLLRLCAH